ncbi:MAG: extracellular solute-binding protein [Hyphomicrobiales bacterium]|nr:extracellular solute-binding protein [Hyphomicrobiales bacterium]MBV8663321.1 extracellular solute-binding protein [Hyphomicrobiales bacterium]
MGEFMRRLTYAAAMIAATLTAFSAAAQVTVRVAYAGSMGVVMDKGLGPAFSKLTGDEFQGIGQGAYGLARLIAGGQVQADVFVSITPGPIRILQDAGLVGPATPVASTSMVIVYNDRGPYAAQFAAARDGKAEWWRVLETPGLKFGRTDPATDPQGQNIIFTMLLAQRYYKQPDLEAKVLGDVANPQQVFGEGSVLARVQAGQLDASSGYESAAVSAKMPFIKLPDEINLSDPALQTEWYDTVSFNLPGKDGASKAIKPQPMVFYAAVLKNSRNAARAARFLDFMTSAEGQKIFKDNGYGEPKGDKL